MGDFICTIPCRENDHWYRLHFWSYGDGTYSVCDSDGNHDDTKEKDIPRADSAERAWREYWKHVAETGEDPLEEFMVKRHVARREAWRFKISASILGAVVTQCERAGKFRWPHELPNHVREYLNLHPRSHAMQDFPSWLSFVEAFPNHNPGTWFRVTIEHKVPRKPETVARELRTAARKALSRA